jgi:hypothetical protein
VNEKNFSNVRWEASKHFRNKKWEYLKDKTSLNKIRDLCRGINEFKKAYQPRTNLVKDVKGVLLADPHKRLNKWKNCFC